MPTKMFMAFSVKHEIPLSRVADLLCCALEGGSNYWYEITSQHEPLKIEFKSNPDLKPGIFPHIDYPLNEGRWLTIKSLEEPEKPAHRLSLATIHEGLKLMASSKTYAHHWRDFMAENEDAITGDVFLQFCLFGEVIYG